MDKRIGFGLYQSCWNSVSVGCVFGLRWCRGLGLGSGRVGWCFVCVSCESGLFLFCHHCCSTSTLTIHHSTINR